MSEQTWALDNELGSFLACLLWISLFWPGLGSLCWIIQSPELCLSHAVPFPRRPWQSLGWSQDSYFLMVIPLYNPFFLSVCRAWLDSKWWNTENIRGYITYDEVSIIILLKAVTFILLRHFLFLIGFEDASCHAPSC